MTAVRPLQPVPDAPDDLEEVGMPDMLDTTLCLVAAAMRAPAAVVHALRIAGDDLPGWSAIWQVIATLAAEGTPPEAVLVQDRLDVSGHLQQRERSKLAAAVTCTAWPEQLLAYAAAVLAARYRTEFRSLAESLISAHEDAPEAELERLLGTHRERLLDLRARLLTTRQENL